MSGWLFWASAALCGSLLGDFISFVVCDWLQMRRIKRATAKRFA